MKESEDGKATSNGNMYVRDSADMAQSFKDNGLDSTKAQQKKQRKKLKRVLKDHPEFELTYDMQIGIRHVLGMQAGGVNQEFSQVAPPALDDFEDVIKLDFLRRGSQKTPPHQSRDFSFKAYAPKIFRRLRERFGISSLDFITSVCGNFEYLSFKTNSKSGQFFFYSHDQRYMLKTMTSDECKLLMKILPAYYEHVMDNPNTLLCRFYGMHRVKPAYRVGGGFHFLIMESVFNTKSAINRIFDLKGSRIGRYAKRGETVYKDSDFAENGFGFTIPKVVGSKLKEVVKKDADFLRENLLMDYSLLVGISYKNGKIKPLEYKQDRIRRLKNKNEKKTKQEPIGVPKKYNIISQPKEEKIMMSRHVSSGDLKDMLTKKPSKRTSFQPAHHGGLRSVGPDGRPGNEIYYIGVIDILTEWGMKKTIENRWRSMFKDGNLISCVHPDMYANRFEDFLTKRIACVEEERGEEDAKGDTKDKEKEKDETSEGK